MSAAFAVGRTGEQDALLSLYESSFPLALSRDGRWVLHVDGANVLHRKRVGDEQTIESIELGDRVRALSVSADGARAAIVMANACVGIVRFTGAGPASTRGDKAALAWLENHLVGLERAVSCTALSQSGEIARHSYAAAVAISEDGNLVAAGWDPVRVVDLRTKRVVHVIPTGTAEVLHLRFVDNDRKLLVIHALMGENYGPDGPSDMQFAVWDLAKKDLLSFRNTKTRGNLLAYDLLWSFSDTTGELWAINTNGEYWQKGRSGDNADRRQPIRPYRTNLRHCAAAKRTMPPLPPGDGDGWLAFTADPLGRYVAGVALVHDENPNRTVSTLWVREARTGKLLSEWPLKEELRALAASVDGATLFGVTGSHPSEREPNPRRGTLLKFDLSSSIARLTPTKAAAWTEQRCVLENEAPGAREVALDAKRARRLFEIDLSPPDSIDTCMTEDLRVRSPATWGRSRDGTLWVDRGKRLERIAPTSGRAVQTVSKPRTGTLCSVALFERGQFLTWQGDTLTVRQFTQPAAHALLVRKPGWIATRVALVEDRIGVRWMDRRYKGIPGDHPEGSGLAVTYTMAGKPVTQTRGRAGAAEPIFADEGDYSSVFDPPPRRVRALAQAGYRWEMSYMGSVRAYQRDAASKSERTVFWTGLRVEGRPPARPQYDASTPPWVASLSGALGAHVHATGVTIYDAARRRRITTIRVDQVQNIAWDAKERILFVEARRDDAQKGSQWKLHGYRIDSFSSPRSASRNVRP